MPAWKTRGLLGPQLHPAATEVTSFLEKRLSFQTTFPRRRFSHHSRRLLFSRATENRPTTRTLLRKHHFKGHVSLLELNSTLPSGNLFREHLLVLGFTVVRGKCDLHLTPTDLGIQLALARRLLSEYAVQGAALLPLSPHLQKSSRHQVVFYTLGDQWDKTEKTPVLEKHTSWWGRETVSREGNEYLNHTACRKVVSATGKKERIARRWRRGRGRVSSAIH